MQTQQNSCLHFLHVMWLIIEFLSFNHLTSKEHDLLASSVLLNRTLTLRTLLRVTLYPVGCLTVVTALLEPHPRDSTHNRPVVILNRASKTKLVLFPSETETCSAFFRIVLTGDPASATGHGGHNSSQTELGRSSLAGNGVRARRIRAVLEIFLGANKVTD